MKNILLIVIFILVASCSSDDNPAPQNPVEVDNSGLTMTPTANIQFNGSNFGIYKGVFVGSSGTIVIDVNNSAFINATLTVEGVQYLFTTDEQVTLDQPIVGLTFTDGINSFDFNVDANGMNAQLSLIYVEAHQFGNIEVVKEYSDALVRCYTGTFSGDQSGIFNLIRIENSLYGLQKYPADANSYYIQGTINPANLNIAGSTENITFSGTASGGTLQGTWQSADAQSGTWTVSRTL